VSKTGKGGEVAFLQQMYVSTKLKSLSWSGMYVEVAVVGMLGGDS
jgi:hypothetical protein